MQNWFFCGPQNPPRASEPGQAPSPAVADVGQTRVVMPRWTLKARLAFSFFFFLVWSGIFRMLPSFQVCLENFLGLRTVHERLQRFWHGFGLPSTIATGLVGQKRKIFHVERQCGLEMSLSVAILAVVLSTFCVIYRTVSGPNNNESFISAVPFMLSGRHFRP